MLIGLRSQGVTVEYVRELKELGYAGLAAGELIEMRSHGVTPEFVRDLEDAGYDRSPRASSSICGRMVWIRRCSSA